MKEKKFYHPLPGVWFHSCAFLELSSSTRAVGYGPSDCRALRRAGRTGYLGVGALGLTDYKKEVWVNRGDPITKPCLDCLSACWLSKDLPPVQFSRWILQGWLRKAFWSLQTNCLGDVLMFMRGHLYEIMFISQIHNFVYGFVLFKRKCGILSLEYFLLTTVLQRKDKLNTNPQEGVWALEVIFPADWIARRVPDRFSNPSI